MMSMQVANRMYTYLMAHASLNIQNHHFTVFLTLEIFCLFLDRFHQPQTGLRNYGTYKRQTYIDVNVHRNDINFYFFRFIADQCVC